MARTIEQHYVINNICLWATTVVTSENNGIVLGSSEHQPK